MKHSPSNSSYLVERRETALLHIAEARDPRVVENQVEKTYIATEKTQLEIKEFLTDIHTKLGNAAEMAFPHFIVTAIADSTITVTNGISTLETTGEPIDGTPNSVFKFSIPCFGNWTISCTRNGSTKTKKIYVDAVAEYRVTMCGYRFGYRISKTEKDPDKRVEYLYDAVGLRPAKMYSYFNYGDWGDKWFVTENKPCMLKSDGTIDYYLLPTNYKFKEDGTSSDIEDANYDGNAMSLIPLVWVKRYEDDDYLYEIISDIQFDDDYKAYAHTRADGSIADWFAWSIYRGSGSESKIRSLSNQEFSHSLTAEQEVAGATANGSGWYTHTWSQHELIRTLLILMGKSTDTQKVFGGGDFKTSSNSNNKLITGLLNVNGQFYGYSSSNSKVKVFHIEDFWGAQWDRTAGVMKNHSGQLFVKMTPEGDGYKTGLDNGVAIGYHDSGITQEGTSPGYISSAVCSEYGIIPKKADGSSTTYFCDELLFVPEEDEGSSDDSPYYLLTGSSRDVESGSGGAFTFNILTPSVRPVPAIGCGLSYIQSAVSA